MDVDIKDVREKGRAWDTFRDHASSWAELMMSVDTKVDHLSMWEAVLVIVKMHQWAVPTIRKLLRYWKHF